METIILIEGIRDTSDVIHDAGHARATYSQRYLFYLRDIGSPFAPISWSISHSADVRVRLSSLLYDWEALRYDEYQTKQRKHKRSNENTNELSTDINVITAEINAYQRVAGEAIFEIGRRLKHVKENDLAHGEFGKWLDEVGINDRVARMMMKVSEELESKRSTYSDIGMNALYQIATLPPEHREAEHVTAKGETKTPDEMTVRELRELKRQLKEERRERERLAKFTDQ